MTKELKNLYENLIDQLVIDGIIANYKGNKKDELIKLFEKDLPLEYKRSAALKAIEELNKDNVKLHSLMFEKIRGMHDDYSRMAYAKKLVGLMREYVKVGKEEVKKFGEVMTPIELVEEMLDTLPPRVWTNPDLKWLDPCNGVGIFPAVIVERLMKGLTKAIPDQKERYQHIVENMIHVCELQHKNLFLHMCAFDPKDLYAMNVYCGSYLDEGFDTHAMEVWGVEKFDIIVMNPPYQEHKEGNKKSKPLWNLFVIKTLEQLNETGYLVAVHPSGWRNVSGTFKRTQEELKKHQILSLEIHNVDDGIKTFGAATRYDFYCLQNVEPTMFTKIVCEDGTIERADISQMEFIPNGRFDEFVNLLANDGDEKVNVLYSRSAYGNDKPNTAKEIDGVFKYPCVQNVNMKNEISSIWYSNTNQKGHFGIPKVIFGRRSSGVFIDELGEYGMADQCAGIVDEPKNLFFIQRAMLNPDFIELSKMLDFGGVCSNYNWNIIPLFRKNFWEEFQPA